MNKSSRNRLPCPLGPVSSVSSLPVAEPQTHTDELGLIQANLQSNVSPALATVIAMLTAEMQTLETHPDFTLCISIGIGSYRRTAELHNGTWQGHDLTHHFDDNRSRLRYSEPARPSPMAPLRPDLRQTSPATSSSAPVNTGNNPPTSPVTTQQFTCLLPAMPPPMLTSTSASASTCIRRLHDSNPQLMLPSTFRAEGVEEAGTSAQNTDNATENTTTNQTQRTVAMRNPFDVPIMKDVVGCQDLYDALLPPPPTDPQHLIGFQANPELQEQQKIQEKAETSGQNSHRSQRRAELKGAKQDRTIGPKEKGQRISQCKYT